MAFNFFHVPKKVRVAQDLFSGYQLQHHLAASANRHHSRLYNFPSGKLTTRVFSVGAATPTHVANNHVQGLAIPCQRPRTMVVEEVQQKEAAASKMLQSHCTSQTGLAEVGEHWKTEAHMEWDLEHGIEQAELHHQGHDNVLPSSTNLNIWFGERTHLTPSLQPQQPSSTS